MWKTKRSSAGAPGAGILPTDRHSDNFRGRAWQAFLLSFNFATQFHINESIFQTQDDMYPLFTSTSTSQHCIIDRNRTIAAPVDTDGIHKLEGSSGLPLATTSLANANSSPPTILPSR